MMGETAEKPKLAEELLPPFYVSRVFFPRFVSVTTSMLSVSQKGLSLFVCLSFLLSDVVQPSSIASSLQSSLG